MAKKKVTDNISEWMADFGRENGYELSRVEFIKEVDSWYLRVFIDKVTASGYSYMSIDDCETVSRYISAKLDEADAVTQNYFLEVSSPGLDRPLITDKDFLRFAGEIVDIKLYHPLNGNKTLQGKLIGIRDGVIAIADEKGIETYVPQKQASKVSLAIIF